MRILKSGIEMTPDELTKLKAGVCACGCGTGFNAEALNSSGSDGKECYCGCIGPIPDAFRDMFGAGADNLHPNV